MKKKRKYEKLNITFGLTFAALLFGASVVSVIYPDSAYSGTEKRSLAQFPALNAVTLADGSFMDGLEDYEADQFPGRNSIMQIKTAIEEALGKKVSHSIVRLDDNHLAECFKEPDEKTTDELIASICDFAKRYPDKDTYMLLAPTAIGVYGDKIGDYIPTDDQNAYIDKVLTGVSSDITALDVRNAFTANKDAIELYYKTDHHWTSEGAYLAFTSTAGLMGNSNTTSYVCGTVSNNFSGTLTSSSGFSVKKLDDITVYLPQDEEAYTVNIDGEGKLSASCYDTQSLTGDDPYQVFFGGNHASMTIKTAAASSKKLLIIKDSYANCFIPFLLSEYKQITVIDPRYYYDDLDMQVLVGGYTDILFLYNANTLSEDNSLVTVLRKE